MGRLTSRTSTVVWGEGPKSGSPATADTCWPDLTSSEAQGYPAASHSCTRTTAQRDSHFPARHCSAAAERDASRTHRHSHRHSHRQVSSGRAAKLAPHRTRTVEVRSPCFPLQALGQTILRQNLNGLFGVELCPPKRCCSPKP